jgi:hypothetical protein
LDNLIRVINADNYSFEYSQNSILLKDPAQKVNVSISNDDISGLDIINDNNNFAASFAGTFAIAGGNPPSYANMQDVLNSNFSIVSNSNRLALNVNGNATAYRALPDKFHYSCSLVVVNSVTGDVVRPNYVMFPSELGNGESKTFMTAPTMSLPIGDYKLMVLGTWAETTGVATSLVVNSMSISAAITYNLQLTEIGKNGFASLWSSNEYFIVQKLLGGLLNISMAGALHIENCDLSSLPTNAQGLNVGNLYRDGNVIKIVI